MRPAQRDGELITGLPSKRPRLRVAQVMGVGWLAATDEARLPGDVPKVVLVAVTAGLGNRECAGILSRRNGAAVLAAAAKTPALPAVSAAMSVESFSSKASSMRVASAVTSVFLDASELCAQAVASSVVVSPSISARSRSRSSADRNGSSVPGWSALGPARPFPEFRGDRGKGTIAD
jgi:hypothetical protein